MIKLFWATLSFSRLPVPIAGRRLEIDRYVRGIVTFPLVGALLGGLGGLYFLCRSILGGLPLTYVVLHFSAGAADRWFSPRWPRHTCDGVFPPGVGNGC